MDVSLDRNALKAAVACHGSVARVVILAAEGSTPRDTGTSMLVWENGQSGTIGGGALEWEAAKVARGLLQGGEARQVFKLPLGPGLGQCCGGAVTLGLERFDAATLEAVPQTGLHARPMLRDASPTPPLAVARAQTRTRNGQIVETHLSEGWLIEPLASHKKPLWIYGAGHVGRAIATAAKGLPFEIVLIDDAKARFPDALPRDITPLVSANPADAVAHAPDEALHLVLTYSHALDLEICHRVLSRPFRHLGLIGSDTKKRRFLKRLGELGHGEASLARLICPIGNKALGKQPNAIAIGVLHDLLEMDAETGAGQSEVRA